MNIKVHYEEVANYVEKRHSCKYPWLIFVV